MILDVLFNVFAIMIAIAITASTNEGEQPDTPNFILIELTFPLDSPGGLPTAVRSPSEPSSYTIEPLYQSARSAARETEGLFLIIPAEQGDWEFAFPVGAKSKIWTRNGEEEKSLSLTREVTVK